MNFKEARDYAMHRGRVRNIGTGRVGNLVDWMPGQYCKVFEGYDRIGACNLPRFNTWLKSETEKESNNIPVGKV